MEGIPSAVEKIEPSAIHPGATFLLVKNWRLAGCMPKSGRVEYPFELNQNDIVTAEGGGCDGSGLAGQGDPNPTGWLTQLFVVRYGKAVYDPAYGILQDANPTYQQNLNAYANTGGRRELHRTDTAEPQRARPVPHLHCRMPRRGLGPGRAVHYRARMVATPLVYDPYDYAIDANPHPVWARLREESPVYYNERLGFYALSRFDDVLRAHLDPDTFSSAHSTVLELMNEEPDEFMKDFMIFMDPPVHTRYRKLVSRAFTPRHISALEPRVRALTGRFLDEFVGAGGFDYVADFERAPPRDGHLRVAGRPRGRRASAPGVDRRVTAPRRGQRDDGRAERSRPARDLRLLAGAFRRPAPAPT